MNTHLYLDCLLPSVSKRNRFSSCYTLYRIRLLYVEQHHRGVSFYAVSRPFQSLSGCHSAMHAAESNRV